MKTKKIETLVVEHVYDTKKGWCVACHWPDKDTVRMMFGPVGNRVFVHLCSRCAGELAKRLVIGGTLARALVEVRS